MLVKARKQGNSLMITIPADFKVTENTEYEVIQNDNGVISFIPAHRNIFRENPNYNLKKALKQLDLGDNGKAVGKEDAW